MTQISSIKFAELGNVEFATITFDNGAGCFARVIKHDETACIIYFNNKLVNITLPSYECEVLCEGVTIK